MLDRVNVCAVPIVQLYDPALPVQDVPERKTGCDRLPVETVPVIVELACGSDPHPVRVSVVVPTAAAPVHVASVPANVFAAAVLRLPFDRIATFCVELSLARRTLQAFPPDDA